MQTAFWATLLAAQVADAQVPRQAKRFVLKSEQRVYEVGVNFSYQTTVWMPVECQHPAVGDPEYFAVLFDKKKSLQKRFVVSALEDRPGTTTNVTFSCQEGVRIVLKVTQVPAPKAALSVEFDFDETETARVRAAVATTRQQCEEDLEKKLADSRVRFSSDAERQFAEGLLARLVYSDDTERDKFDFVNVKAFTTLLVGDKGYLLFEVQNRTPNPVMITRAEVVDEETDIALPEARLVMPEPRVASGNRSQGVVVFGNPGDARRLALVLFEDGPREMRLGDIEL